MDKSVAIAVFVKTPYLSSLKTRLAKEIGDKKALEFYLLSIEAIKSVLKNYNLYFAVGEKEGVSNKLWNGFNTLYTESGNLGERQVFVFNTLIKKYKKVILLGADTPQINKKIINDTISYLDKYENVIGRANDGGYYLFSGYNELNAKDWSSVPWSSEDTLTSLVKVLDSNIKYLKNLSDVDYKSDLEKVITEIDICHTNEQANLLSFIKNNI